MPPYYVRTGYPSLTPSYGLGSYGRTGPALLISSPRTKIGSQGRIYSWMVRHNKGPQYVQFLLNTLGKTSSSSGNAFQNIGA
jgi:hypothetical protein